MELRDLICTPFIILFVYGGAYLVRPHVTDSINRRYFIPALSVRMIGAISLGLLYQFYYSGGDTYNYHTFGSRIVWESFIENPMQGLRLIFGDIQDDASVYKYSSGILFLRDPSSFFIVRISSFFDILTFSSYAGTAVLFAATSFAGSWAFYLTFYNRYPRLHFTLALVTFFVPSLFFWGSGILKDTLVLAALGFATYFIDKLLIQRKWSLRTLIYLAISLFIIFEIKKFVLQAFIPAALLWIYFKYLMTIRSIVLRVLIFPVIIGFVSYLGYYIVVKVGEGDARYSVNQLAYTAKITAYDIGFYTGRDAGSHYSLGELEGTFGDMIQKAPAAINVALFRPYLWEAKNLLMFFSAIESLVCGLLVGYVIFLKKGKLAESFKNPDLVFLMTFSIVMAFAVGITSYNFGTLSRYKVTLLPFFLTAMIIVKYKFYITTRTADVKE